MTLRTDREHRAPAPPAEGAPDGSRVRRATALRGTVLLLVLAAGLVVTALAAAGVGAYPVPPLEVLGSVLRGLGLGGGEALDPLTDEVLWNVRFPRVVLAAIVGASLALAGAMMQGIFGNPLAEPGVIGVSSGATVGAVLVIALGASALGYWTVIAAAFASGMITTVLVYTLSRSGGRAEVVTLLLTGIAVNAVAGALIGSATYFSEDAELRSITNWQMGSLAAATWSKVVAALPFAAAGIAAAPFFARRLDLLALGESPARHLGVDVERMRQALIVVIAMLTSSAVAFAGIISFVGLVVPHMVRMVAGPGHRVLLPASVLGGALVLVAADLLARVAAAPQEVPLGIITALIGGPFFFWLLYRTRARQGGWA
ncbi:FecCD family ABC transporter permease [Thermobifida cellulosilytica]|uniref:Hemin ABC transporter permease n=1 Tax=Thermobifida cellulosilytica TB100 TaxID=665004 RepID=A0A147KFZ1_THECS|nr:iron ABC transporter permease [Thermobifida cellulosilytica]KUP96205.1 hemin ABC transporter permease [Thermobifida cellulosilytica TB100]